MKLIQARCKKIPPLEVNKAFKPIKNAIINAVSGMGFAAETFAEYGEEDNGEVKLGEKLYMKWSDDYKTACAELYQNHNIPKAFELLSSESENGNILAHYELGKMYSSGLLGEENHVIADEYFEKALYGFLEIEPRKRRLRDYVQYRIGKMYALGHGAKQDYAKAFGWLKKSAEKGNKFAQYSLGSLYYYGNGIQQNFEKAFEYYKQSADSDNAYACYEGAKMLRGGIGITTNAHQADMYFKKAYSEFLRLAADNPDDKILYRLGVMIFRGTGCDADRDRGMALIRQSAELGNEYAKIFIENSDRVTVQDAVTSLLMLFGRIISDDFNSNYRGQMMRTEHKLKDAIRRKKTALGMKESPLETHQFKEG